jgi:serine/threonine protein kinase
MPVMFGYELGKILGEGGFCVVYEATRRSDGLRVALKTMLLEHRKDHRLVTRFRAEAATLRLLQHPHVVSFLDAHVDPKGGDALVMELLEGQTLGAWLERRGAFDPAQVASLGIMALEGLQMAHAQGILHRDIKPDNLHLDKRAGTPHLKLIDFGVSKSLYAELGLTDQGKLFGTPAYVAPERTQYINLPAGDLYSLGLTLIEAATGAALVRGGDIECLHQHRSPTPHTIPRNLPEGLRQVLARAVEKDPSRRYAYAAEMLRDLRALLAPAPAVAASPSRRPATVAGGPQVDDLVGGRYRLVGALPSANPSVEVFEGLDERLGRRVRVRVVAEGRGPQRSQGWVRVQRERALALTLRHPRAATLLDASELRAASPWLVYERPPGCTLREALAARGRLSEADALAVVTQIAEALCALHDQQVLHRDLHPESVWWCEAPGLTPHVKLADFGMAKSADPDAADLTRADLTRVLGAELRYQAPELIMSGTECPQNDLYALGLIWAELLGQPLLRGQSAQELLREHVQGVSPPPGLGGAAAAVLARLLEARPIDRYPDAGALLAALGALGSAREAPAHQPTAQVTWDPATRVALDPTTGRATLYRHQQASAELTLQPGDALVLERDGAARLLRAQPLDG